MDPQSLLEIRPLGPEKMLAVLVGANLLLPLHSVGRFVIYPLSFLATWIHEMGHVVATILVGGKVKEVRLYSNLGGVAKSKRPDHLMSGLLSPVFGLLAPSLIGALIIYYSGSAFWSEQIWILLSIALVVTAIIWIRNLFGFFFCLALGVGFFWMSQHSGAYLAFWGLQAIGIRFAVETFSDFRYLFTQYVDGQPSDTQLLSEKVGLPYWLWGVVLGALMIGMFGASLYYSWGSLFLH